MLLNLEEAAKRLGVSKSTLRRWEKEGKLTSIRTKGNHRRYEFNDLMRFKGQYSMEKYTIVYARVSTSEQEEDLERQKDSLIRYCMAKGYQFQVIDDIGSGLNYSKKGLKTLIERICSKEIERVVINYKDRLIRFGYEMLEEICLLHGVKIEIVNLTEDKTYEQELVEDVLSIITVFSARLYGSRSHKSKKIKQEVKKILEA